MFVITLLEERVDNTDDRKVFSWNCPLCGEPCPYQRNLLVGYVTSFATNHLLQNHFVKANHITVSRDRFVPVEPEQYATLEELVRRSDKVLPVSVESLVGMALDAFIEGAK